MDKEIPEVYKKLAERNGWNVSYEGYRLYFMAKSGGYATPDDNVTDEDKELLADYISEGSSKMRDLILNCWSNNLRISGPCSGIAEFHDEPPVYVHFGILGPKAVIETLCQSLQEIFPNYTHLLSEGKNDEFRYDFAYCIKNEKVLTKQDSDNIFSIFNEELNKAIANNLKESKNNVKN